VLNFKLDNIAWAFGVFWAVVILVVDVFTGHNLIEAVRSEWFDTTPGIVTKSEITRDGRGRPTFEFEYTYTVNGQQFTGTKYDMQPHFVNNAYFYAAHDANPVGAPVTVHYDPGEPTTAYLAPGVRSDFLFSLWWMTPFNLVWIGFAWVAWWQFSGCRRFDSALRRCVRQTQDGWIVRPDANTRFLHIAFLGLFAIMFCGCFASAAYAMIFEFPPPWCLPLLMWTVALTAPVILGRWGSNHWLIYFNELEGMLRFRHNEEWVTLPRADVLGIDLKTETRMMKRDAYEPPVPYEVVIISLRWRDKSAKEQRTLLAEYASAEDAAALASWFTERLNLPSPTQVAGASCP
jgi:hypothetical protein